MAAESVEKEQRRQYCPAIEAPAQVNIDRKAVGQQNQKSKSVDHGIAEPSLAQQLFEEFSTKQHGRKSIQEEVQHKARLLGQHREKPHILRARIFINREMVAEQIEEKGQQRRRYPIEIVLSGGFIHIPVPADPHIPVKENEADDVDREVGPRRKERQQRQQHRQMIVPSFRRSRIDPLQQQKVVVKKREGQKMGIAGAIQEHLPLIEAEKHNVYKKHEQGMQPLPQHILPQDQTAEKEPQQSQHPVKGHGIAEELTVQKAQKIGQRNPGQHIRHQQLRRIQGVRQVAVDETDIIRIDHIAAGRPHIEKQRQKAEAGQKKCQCPSQLHSPFSPLSHDSTSSVIS